MTFLAGPRLAARLRRRFPHSIGGVPAMRPTPNTTLSRAAVREWYFAISVERRLKHPAVVAITIAARTEVFG